jgi:lipoprotein-anchoring transpeptidase ErfK/SrfK
MEFGRYEGRSASSEFNLMSYRSLHGDLYLAFGDDLNAYADHYRNLGRAEGRLAMSDNPPRFEPFVRPLIYNMEGIAKGRTDIGKTYVEVDIAGQHLYLFVDGIVIMDTDIVTGDVSRGWSTPTGIFQIFAKQTNRYLRGRDYKVWVNYWLPYKGNYGLHDAGYRTSFGGDVYLTDGSHGCTNIPRAKARTLFDYAFVGMYVIIH